MSIPSKFIPASVRGLFTKDKASIIDGENDRTPILHAGEQMIIGAAPEELYTDDILVGVDLPELPIDSKNLSSTAVAIALNEATGEVEIKRLTQNNTIVVWADDQKERVAINLEVGRDYPDMAKIVGQYPIIDIQMANDKVLRISHASGGGSGAQREKGFLIGIDTPKNPYHDASPSTDPDVFKWYE